MNNIALIARLERITESPAFLDASREELRVLVAVISLGSIPTDYETIADMAGVSAARAKSAVTLFLEEGIISFADEYADVSDEFKVSAIQDRSESTAKEIRDSGLASLIEECAELMGVPALPTEDVKTITSLYADLGLACEYILALTAYLAGKIKDGKKLTVRRLAGEASKLKDKGIDTFEALEVYLMEKEKEIKDEWEYRRVLGLGGTISDRERKYIDKWAHEYEFSVAILSLGFEITRINTGKTALPYMDKLFTSWHEAGCKTLEDCEREHQKNSGVLKDKFAPSDAKSRQSTTRVAETPKYSEFNSEDALMKALERSYGTDKQD